MITVEEIVKKRFSRSVLGYDIGEVDLFLDAVIEQMEAYERERKEMMTAMDYLLKELEQFDGVMEGIEKVNRERGIGFPGFTAGTGSDGGKRQRPDEPDWLYETDMEDDFAEETAEDSTQRLIPDLNTEETFTEPPAERHNGMPEEETEAVTTEGDYSEDPIRKEEDNPSKAVDSQTISNSFPETVNDAEPDSSDRGTNE